MNDLWDEIAADLRQAQRRQRDERVKRWGVAFAALNLVLAVAAWVVARRAGALWAGREGEVGNG